MNKLLLALLIALSPIAASAVDVNVDLGQTTIRTPGGSITFGDRDKRGYYWDGDDWRAPDYWRKHNGPRGERHYTGRGKGVPHQDGGFCPPGQAKKGRC